VFSDAVFEMLEVLNNFVAFVDGAKGPAVVVSVDEDLRDVDVGDLVEIGLLVGDLIEGLSNIWEIRSCSSRCSRT
jgi:hypothetical protein